MIDKFKHWLDRQKGLTPFTNKNASGDPPDLHVTRLGGNAELVSKVRTYSHSDSELALKSIVQPVPMHVSRPRRVNIIEVIPTAPPQIGSDNITDIDADANSPKKDSLRKGSKMEQSQQKPPSMAGRPLTKLDIQVLQMLSNGSSYEEIAKKIRVATITIETHFKVIHEKLEVDNDQQAIVKAKNMNVLD